MKRLLHIVALIALLFCCASCGFLWHRSYLAYDELVGRRFGHCFEIDACNGCIQIWIREPYKTLAGDGQQIGKPSFNTLTVDPVPDGPFTRWRSPLADTDYWQARPPVFAGFKWNSWFGWDKSVGGWEWCRLIQLPYWFFFFVAVVATLVLAIFRHPIRVRRAGLCKACGYDLRASPIRCPECGATDHNSNPARNS
jgi:hypothetical protein